MRTLSLWLLILFGCFACDSQKNLLPGALPASGSSANSSLASINRGYLNLGVALKNETLTEANSGLVLRNFNRITAEYEMKWGPMMKGQHYDFAAADKLSTFAKGHGLHMTGHALIWHLDNPAWVFQDQSGRTIDRATLQARIKNHVTTVVKHFKGKVDSWDVVNEAIADEASLTYRPSAFFEIYGNEDYIVDAFRAAREADPRVELWYNDYVLESPSKLAKLLVLIQRLKAENIDITGIGFQGHYNLSWPGVDLIETAFQAVIAEGLKIKISELDMTIYEDYTDGIYTPEAPKPCNTKILKRQADRYAELFNLFRRYSEDLSHITFWGLKDDTSWLNEQVKDRRDCPLLFDAGGESKPAFFTSFP